MTIHRLLYRSDSALVGSTDSLDSQVADIVRQAEEVNKAAGLTGALLLSSGVFIQALEGPLKALEATFERICGDLRHRRVKLLELAIAKERAFDCWAMVSIQPNLEIARLCSGLEFVSNPEPMASTASAAISMMRTVLLTNAAPASWHAARCSAGR